MTALGALVVWRSDPDGMSDERPERRIHGAQGIQLVSPARGDGIVRPREVLDAVIGECQRDDVDLPGGPQICPPAPTE